MAAPSESLPYYDSLVLIVRAIFDIERRFDLDVRTHTTKSKILKTFAPVTGFGKTKDGIDLNRLRILRFVEDSSGYRWYVQPWTGERGVSTEKYFLHPTKGVQRGTDAFNAVGVTGAEALALLNALRNLKFGGVRPDPFKD